MRVKMYYQLYVMPLHHSLTAGYVRLLSKPSDVRTAVIKGEQPLETKKDECTQYWN